MKKILYILTVLVCSLSIISCNKTNEKVEKVISLIDELPEVISLEDESKISNIDNLYNELSKEEKELVTNYNIFISQKEALNSLLVEKNNKDSASNVISLIDNLPSESDFTLDNKDDVLSASKAYLDLNKDAQKYVTNVDKLNSLLDLINDLDECLKVVDAIEGLSKEITLNDEELIVSVRALYNNLSDDLKEYVTNLSVLESAEQKISSLKKAYEAAQKVVKMIDDLPSKEELTYDDKKQVESVRGYYTILSSSAKPFVTNLSKLVELEEIMDELSLIERYKKNASVVVNMINNLPSELTIDDRYDVDDCLIAYNNLLDEEKEYVTNYMEFVKMYEKMQEIIANTSYDVTVVLDGGYLENMQEVVEKVNITSFTLNNYSCNVWSAYTTDILIYKTSLMSSGDQYTSFKKVGFSYDNSLGEYVINQIVEVGTALKAELRTSEYYILVHSDYSAGFSKVNLISIGNIISFSGLLPNESSSNLSYNVFVYKTKTSSNYKITLRGITTLPVPVKTGYEFIGWYLDPSFTSDIITEVSESVTVYAKWTVDRGEITTETILNCVSDLATSQTSDILLLENDDATFTWSSSNNDLYTISNGMGVVSKVNQTHKKQKVTVSVIVKYKTGTSKTLSKEITINPIYFGDISTTPIATYFYTGAISGYKKYNDRYVQNKTLFSDTTKETLDIIYYSFIVPKSDGSVSFQDASYMKEVRALRNHNVRIIGCVNGVGSDTSQAFKTITASSSLRAKFVNNLMNLVEQYNLDGLDLDWEAVSESLTPVASQYNLLCEELRNEMNKRQDEGGTPYLLTMAVPASSYGTSEDRFDFKTLNKYLDYINIMSYDLNNSAKTTHLSPLYTSSYDNGYGFSATYGVSRISSLGFDKNKLIIGCAGYGKAYKVTSSSGAYPALGTSGTLTKISGYDGSFASGTVYGSVINQLINSGKYTLYTEKTKTGLVVGSYLYSSTDKIFITFDSKEAVMAKYEYAYENGLGMMCWAYTEDTSDTVINAIYEAKNK